MRAALLPLLAPERQIASLPRRAMAGFLDLCVCVISFRLFLFLLSTLTGIPITDIPGQRTVLTTVGWFLYLWLSEWMTGWTIGKRILKLKIVDSQTVSPARTRKLLLRTTIFLACMESVRYIHEGFYSLVAIPISSVGYSGQPNGRRVIDYAPLETLWIETAYTRVVQPNRNMHGCLRAFNGIGAVRLA